MAKTTVPVRVEPSEVERLDAIAEEMGRRAAGLEVTRSDAVRVVLAEGLPIVEKKLGLTPPAEGKRAARKPRK